MISTISPGDPIAVLGKHAPVLPATAIARIDLAKFGSVGFSTSDLEILASKIPNFQFKVLTFPEGHSTHDIVKDAFELHFTFKQPVVFKLHGKILIVNQNSQKTDLVNNCQTLLLLKSLDPLVIDPENQSIQILRANCNKIYRALPQFLQDWIDERTIADDLGPKHQIVQVALDALKLYAHFDESSEIIAYWNRVREDRLRESDPVLQSDYLMLAAKIVMIELEGNRPRR